MKFFCADDGWMNTGLGVRSREMVRALQSAQSQDLNEIFVGHGSMKGDLFSSISFFCSMDTKAIPSQKCLQ